MTKLENYSRFSQSFIVLLCSDQVAYHFIENLAFYLIIILAKVYVQKHLSNSDFNKGEWRSLGYDLMKLLTLEGTSRE